MANDKNKLSIPVLSRWSELYVADAHKLVNPPKPEQSNAITIQEQIYSSSVPLTPCTTQSSSLFEHVATQAPSHTIDIEEHLSDVGLFIFGTVAGSLCTWICVSIGLHFQGVVLDLMILLGIVAITFIALYGKIISDF